jgi:hypothetical protein
VVVQTGDEKILVRVSGASGRRRTFWRSTLSRTAASSASAISPMSRGFRRSSAANVPRTMGRMASGLRSPCARAAMSWRSGATSSGPWRRSRRTCR